MTRLEWDDAVYTAIEINYEVTRSDAQAFADAWLESEGAAKAYKNGVAPAGYAAAIWNAGVQP